MVREPFPRSTITEISVQGFKSIMEPITIAIAPLTVLAGANSSGKSSIIQPLLLLKQTLEATYDPGPLLLNGPNVRFSSAEQLFSSISQKKKAKELVIKLTVGANFGVSSTFGKGKGIELLNTVYQRDDRRTELKKDLSAEQLRKMLPVDNPFSNTEFELKFTGMTLNVVRNRCFFETFFGNDTMRLGFAIVENGLISPSILDVIHLPGLRGNPERAYPVSAVGSKFTGTFEMYTASILTHWNEENKSKLEAVNKDLLALGLTAMVMPVKINDTQVELHVSRLPNETRPKDTVNIADVGFGVSQSLPLIVALNAASPGQVVYVEQPEIHLHPRAQSNLAYVLAKAAKRGVHVIVETHSNLLILGIQTLVAQKKLRPEDTQFHWFSRRPRDGVTEVSSVQLDERGRYGGWPEDFAEVLLDAEDHYLTAAVRNRGS